MPIHSTIGRYRRGLLGRSGSSIFGSEAATRRRMATPRVRLHWTSDQAVSAPSARESSRAIVLLGLIPESIDAACRSLPKSPSTASTTETLTSLRCPDLVGEAFPDKGEDVDIRRERDRQQLAVAGFDRQIVAVEFSTVPRTRVGVPSGGQWFLCSVGAVSPSRPAHMVSVARRGGRPRQARQTP